jgi:hypothetical protein
MSVIVTNNLQNDTTRTAAVRVKHVSLRWRKYFAGGPTDADGVDGEAQHIEAIGKIFIPIAHRLSAEQCASLPEHAHCEGHIHLSPDAGACCLINETFPVSMHFDVPAGDGVVPALGDRLVVTIRRGEYPLTVHYDPD